MFVADLETLSVLDVNDAALKKYGYTRDEFLHLTTSDIGVAEHSGEQRHYLKNGEFMDMEVMSHPFELEGQKLALFMAQDITQRKQVERDLLESKLTAERYLNIVAEIIVALDCDGNITHLNESGRQLLGYQEGLIGQNWFDTCIPEEDRDEVRRFFEMLKRGEIQHIEARENSVVTKGRERKIILWHHTVLKDQDGKFLGTLSSGDDITNRMEMEKVLRIALAKYKVLFECLPLGVTISDEAGNILETNPIAAKLLDIPRDEHVQRSIDDPRWKIVRPDGTNMPSSEYASVRALKEKRLIENVEMGIVIPNRPTIWLNVTAAPLPTERYGVVVAYGDITTRKQAEEALKESEWRNKIVSELTADYIFVVDVYPNGILKLRWASDNMFRMTGRTVEDAATSDLWGNIIHPDDKARFFGFVDKIISTAETGEIECRAFYKHGGERWIHIFARPQAGEGNIVMTIVGAIDDITDRKRAEKALQESEARNRALVDAMPDLMFIHDRAGVYLDYHAADPQLLAASPNVLLGRAIRDIFPPELADPLQAKLDLAFQTGRVQTHEYALELADGRHYFEARINAYDLDRAVSIIRDVTDRKQSEEALRRSEEKYRTVANFTYDWEAWRGPDGTYLYVSPSCERITGHSAEEFITDPNLVIKIAYPDDQSKVGEHFMADMNQSKVQNHHLDFRIIAADGRVRWIGHYCMDVYDDSGQWMGRRESNRDITERKQAEESLESANVELKAAFEREKELAHTDALTGVNNRRNLYKLAAQEFKIAIRYHQPLSIIMFDLDHFKKVNDTFGHMAGDQVLVQVTQAARAELRSADSIGRYGGEEFVVLLPMTNAQQAYPLAERIRERVSKIVVPTPVGDATVTLSIGIVEITQEGGKNESVDELIRRADQAMYAAKQGGRNRTVILKQPS